MSKKNSPVYTSLNNYVNQLNISQELKSFLLDESIAKDTTYFYLEFPHIYAKAFAIDEEEVINRVSIARFFYYKSLVLLDNIYDSTHKELLNSPYTLIVISALQEESIKILSHFFGLESPFWKVWNKRKTEYLKSIIFEKETPVDSRLSFSKYKKLADIKSGFAKATLDVLYHLNTKGKKETYQKLSESHRLFTIAMQLSDDVSDIKEDFENGQFNWAYRLTVDLLEKEDIHCKNIDDIKKYMYIEGVAKKMFKKSIQYHEKAIYVLEDINVNGWVKNIQLKIESSKKSIEKIDKYLSDLREEIRLSKKKQTNK